MIARGIALLVAGSVAVILGAAVVCAVMRVGAVP